MITKIAAVFEKNAFALDRTQVRRGFDDLMHRKGLGIAMVGGAIASHAISKAVRGIQNNIRKKAIIEDLMMTDPVIKNADKAEVLQYYAMIDHISPKLSLEKPIVKELLQNFIRFGRVDINTVKMLAETESRANRDEGGLDNIMSLGHMLV